MKNDEGKLQWSLIPFKQLEPVVKVLEEGVKKYGRENWKTVEKRRFKDALLRHVLSYIGGEEVDAEDGLSALAHIICNCLFLEYLQNNEKPEN